MKRTIVNSDVNSDTLSTYGDQIAVEETSKMTNRSSTLSPIMASFSMDGLVLLIAGLAAYFFSKMLTESSVVLTTDASTPAPWLAGLSILFAPILFFILDGFSALGNRLKLPFAGGKERAQRIFAQRFHLILLALYFNAILVALCWSAPAMVAFSKIFLAAVFAIAIFAMGQSIPSMRLSFIVSGVLFFIVLIATQTFIIIKMDAEQQSAQDELRQQLEFGNDDADQSDKQDDQDNNPL